MSQASLIIADGHGDEVLTRISNALQALGTYYYGATDPATNNIAVPLMIWADSGNNLAKQRNAANTAWIPKGILMEDGTIQWYEPLALPLTGGSLAGALHQPNPVAIATVSGVLTLTEDSNSFVVSGTEPVTAITGWTSGKVQVRWAAARTITHNDTNLILQGKTNRTVSAGDISEFETTVTGVRETNYFPSAGAGSGEQIGSIKAWLATTVPPGWLALDTGALVDRASYPQLWAWVQQYAPLITEAAWQTQAAAQTSVGAYSSGDGSTTFRLPKIVDFVRGSNGTRTPGTWQADALQNITGTFSTSAIANITGAFSQASTYSGNGRDSQPNAIISLDASRVARTADETRPKSVAMLYCVKAFDAPTNQGLIDITALANLVNLKANQSDFANSLGTNGYQKLPGGLILQWGQDGVGTNPNTILFPVTFPNNVFAISITPAINGSTGYTSLDSNIKWDKNGFAVRKSGPFGILYIVVGN